MNEKRITGDWKQLLSDEVYNLYYSPDIVELIKLRKKVPVRVAIDLLSRCCSNIGHLEIRPLARK
jgi:hypothetical protein